MIVRFGFVAMSLLLENASPSRTMTYATLSKLDDREAGIRKLERIAEENLQSTLRILKHSKAHEIAMYRFSSKLIPLATHEGVAPWNPYEALAPAFREVGGFAKEKGIRVSFHPDHFCVFSTPRPEVLQNSEKDLIHHVRMLELMNLDETAKNNIHMGGAYGDKVVASERFIEQFSRLSPTYKHRVTLENDDKTFNVKETLAAAEIVGVPMVLDIHHHAVNPGDILEDELIEALWPRIDHTWQIERIRLGLADISQLPPKIHASSPKSLSDPRGHADFVEAEPLLHFLRGAARTTSYLDCMLEAKSKDAALLQLMKDMKELEQNGQGVRVIDGGTIEVTPL
ncbi:UV DNA damage repair endonuclease UvsE [Paenibacillus sp. GSMTC-2017]|uniref:UV DNA damage repair endonuclease UvsE n=1 Tax=Paenibacillus sp. GSMTC-2017 TaxID=2794350 RepID=UPI0018D650BF|nr:UV DNA damage repair endonuclease UvsE [Paenibacillus sp. GSMTC-2017]MBH5318954.1 UV DNA damage repair endonuclease UvsE [Paenibacillus sp. GSMTC-2017]